MAIFGSMQLEDVAVQWTNVPQPGIEMEEHSMFVQVSEAQPDGTTKHDSFVCDGRMFMTALATAISWDGDVPDSAESHAAWWREVESVAAISKIRFMP